MNNHKFIIEKKSSSYYVMVICCALYCISYMDQQLLSVLIQPIKLDLNLSDATAGMIQTSFLLGLGFFSLPIAFLIDRLSRPKAIFIMSIIWSLGTFVAGFAQNAATFILLVFIMGLGEAGFSSAGTALITAFYPKNKHSIKLGIFNMFIVIGMGLGLILGGHLSQLFNNWRIPFYLFPVPGIIFGILALFMKDYKLKIDETKVKPKMKNFLLYDLPSSVMKILKIPAMKWLYLGFSMHIIISISVINWAPSLIIRRFHIDEGMSGTIIAILGCLSIPGAFLGGLISDRWQKKSSVGRIRFAILMELTSTLSLIISIFSIFILKSEMNDPLFYIGIFFGAAFFFSIIGGIAAIGTTTQNIVTPNLKGLSWGMAVFFQYIPLGAFGPFFVGKLSEFFNSGSDGLAYALLLISFAGILGVLCWLKSSRIILKTSNDQETHYSK